MERELVALFEAAKKAADAAASADSGVEEGRCVDALHQLKNFPVTYHVLVSTQVQFFPPQVFFWLHCLNFFS